MSTQKVAWIDESEIQVTSRHKFVLAFEHFCAATKSSTYLNTPCLSPCVATPLSNHTFEFDIDSSSSLVYNWDPLHRHAHAALTCQFALSYLFLPLLMG